MELRYFQKIIEDINYKIENFEDENKRYIDCFIWNKSCVCVCSKCSDVLHDDYNYKLSFFDALKKDISNKIDSDEKMVVGGDFNVALKMMCV